MKPMDPLRVMQAHDGELPDEEVRSTLAAHGAADLAEGFSEIGDLVRELARNQGRPADGIADAVMASIAADRTVGVPAAMRSSLGGQRSGKRPGFPARSWVPLVGLAATLALLLGGVVWRNTLTSTNRVATASAQASGRLQISPSESSQDAAASAQQLQQEVAESLGGHLEATSPVAIEAVEFGEHGGTIFMVTGENQETTPVVWLVDEPGDPGRVETL